MGYPTPLINKGVAALPLNFRNSLAFQPIHLFPSVLCEQKMLWHSRADILHLCAWQCDAPASGKSDLRCLKVSSQKERQQPRALVLQGAGARGQTLLLGGCAEAARCSH